MNISALAQDGEWEIIDKGEGMPPYVAPYYTIDCYDDMNCILFGNYNNKFPINRITTDGGKTWFTNLLDEEDNIAFEVAYPSKNLCVVGCAHGFYWISRDRFETWEKVELDTIQYGDRSFGNTYFYNDSVGCLTTQWDIYYTKDACNSFKMFNFTNDFEGKRKWAIDDIFLLEEKTILALIYNYADTVSYFFRTTNSGNDWDKILIDKHRNKNLYFKNLDTGWIAGRYQHPNTAIFEDFILFTSDGGQTWETQLDTLCQYTQGLTIIRFLNDTLGYAYGPARKLWQTTNSGKKWIKNEKFQGDYLNNPFELIDIDFIQGNIIGGGWDSKKIHLFRMNPISVIESEQHQDISTNIFPNPATSQITLSLGEEFISEPEIDIIDYLGNVIRCTTSGRCRTSDKSITINTSSLSPKVYFLRIRSGATLETRKFVVVR